MKFLASKSEINPCHLYLSCLCNIDHNTWCLVKANYQGLLVDLSKKAMITQNYKELDDAIRMKIPQYLYNGGKVKEWKM